MADTMDTTESKLQRLTKAFDEYDKESLLEVLLSCDGSVENAINLLGGSIKDKIEVTSDQSHPPEKSTSTDTIEKETTQIKIDPTEERNVELEVKKRKRQSSSALIQGSLSKLVKMSPLDVSGVDKTITLHSKEEIESVLAVKVFANFLPPDLADEVLQDLINQRLLFTAKEFYIAGNLCRSSQKSILYSDNSRADYDPVYGSSDIKTRPPTPGLRKCQLFVDAKVNEVLNKLYKDEQSIQNILNCDTCPQYLIKSNWESNFCIGNYYPDNKSHLDWHTDKLTNIGPLPTIASLTLGSTRIFRLRRIMPTNSIIYNIPLTNNKLLIMLPSTQEMFRHCVPTLKDSMINEHSKSGCMRFNLTFRMGNPFLEKNPVFCDKCQNRMILRRLFKGEDIGYYVWLCMSSFKGRECKGFKYASFENIKKYDGVIPAITLSTTERGSATRWLSKLEVDSK